MKFDPKKQQKTLKNINKSTKIKKEHPRTGIWPLQGPQEGQDASKRGRNENFGGPLGPRWKAKNHQKVKKVESEN